MDRFIDSDRKLRERKRSPLPYLLRGSGRAGIQICAARCRKVLNSRRPSPAGPSPGNSRRGSPGFQVLSSDKPGDGPVGMPLIKNFPLMRALHICILPFVPVSELPPPEIELNCSAVVTGTLRRCCASARRRELRCAAAPRLRPRVYGA